MDPQPSTSTALPTTTTTTTTASAKNAQAEYTEALNFKEDEPLDVSNPNTSKLKSMMNNVMKGINNSKYIYPTISIAVLVILVIILLFQASTPLCKIIAVLLLVFFVIFTIYYTRT
nr:gp51-like protein [Oryctes rhinoceros nudivirus]WIF19379.1 gp51-like protein [Oryctes rhinoceros nudivirus]